jgi:hypothetical protein
MMQRMTAVETQIDVHGYSVDIFLPKYSLVIEYQGQQHYTQTHTGSYTLYLFINFISLQFMSLTSFISFTSIHSLTSFTSFTSFASIHFTHFIHLFSNEMHSI